MTKTIVTTKDLIGWAKFQGEYITRFVIEAGTEVELTESKFRGTDLVKIGGTYYTTKWGEA